MPKSPAYQIPSADRETLVSLRTKLGLTQRQVERLVGFGPSSVARMEMTAASKHGRPVSQLVVIALDALYRACETEARLRRRPVAEVILTWLHPALDAQEEADRATYPDEPEDDLPE